MVPPKKQKTWNEDRMNEAVRVVVRKEVGYFKISKYSVVRQITMKDV
jgi:predicted glycosyltransferase involved in capsule biosynthesis